LNPAAKLGNSAALVDNMNALPMKTFNAKTQRRKDATQNAAAMLYHRIPKSLRPCLFAPLR